MKCLLGLGSNLGNRLQNFEAAIQLIKRNSQVLKISQIVQTPALVPSGAPLDWQRPFLNAVVEIETKDSPRDLLFLLKNIERELGRTPQAAWGPRSIDLDILTFENQKIEDDKLVIPHPGMLRRQFVLTPLKHMRPSAGTATIPLRYSRSLPQQIPYWMGILNITPDSFSDGGMLSSLEILHKTLDVFDSQYIQMIDLGAESTRPGATPLSETDEWERLSPFVDSVLARYADKAFHPLISVDTYHVNTARRAIELGCDIINDVSGLADERMLSLLSASDCQYILMHSLSVPADPTKVVGSPDPVREVLTWAEGKLELLQKHGISLDRIIFDPGIGFGKTAFQSLHIVQRIEEFLSLPVRVMVGHSRKSFLSSDAKVPAAERDWESLGVSIRLANAGVDILRVHRPDLHARSHYKFMESQNVQPQT